MIQYDVASLYAFVEETLVIFTKTGAACLKNFFLLITFFH